MPDTLLKENSTVSANGLEHQLMTCHLMSTESLSKVSVTECNDQKFRYNNYTQNMCCNDCV